MSLWSKPSDEKNDAEKTDIFQTNLADKTTSYLVLHQNSIQYSPKTTTSEQNESYPSGIVNFGWIWLS